MGYPSAAEAPIPDELLFSAVLSTVHEMIWADGDLDAEELVVAAVVSRDILGEDVDFKLILPVLKRRDPPAKVDRASLPEEHRHRLLAASVELAKADGAVEDEEVEAARALGRELGIADAEDRIQAMLADPTNYATRWKGR